MIETKRLTLIPLTPEQLVKYTQTDGSLEIELGLSENPRTISDELKEALEGTILDNVKNAKKEYLYYTLWSIILKETNTMVGDLCFQGTPNQHGEIEIGYGTYPEFQQQGFMTEAVGGMIEWAKQQSNILFIIASTDKSNVASFKILEKNNFVKIGETEDLFNWKLKIQ